MRKVFYVLFVAAFAILIIGCDGDKNGKKPAPTAIEITAPKMEITVGEQLQLSSAVTPKNAENKAVWTSSDEEIIKIVNKDTGLVEGVAAGTAEVIVTSKADSKIQDRVEIKVNPIVYDAPESVTASVPRETVSIGSVMQITTSVFPATAEQKVEYKSSNPEVATVSATGLITGVALGETEITVTVVADKEIFASIRIYVISGSMNVEAVVIQGEAEMFEGGTLPLSASVLPAGVSQNVLWSSSDETVATVSDKGVVTALKQGSVTITATSVEDKTVSDSHVIVIKPEIPPVEYPNLGGYEIIMYASTGYEWEHDPFESDYKFADKGSCSHS